MSLKIKSWRRIGKWAFWSVLALIFAVVLVRIATFEDYYYNSKEGSERAAAPAPEITLVEEEVTPEEIEDYTVEEKSPRYLTVTKLGIEKARILPMGITTDGNLDTPNNIYDVGWFEASGKPGQGKTMIIDGHNGGPYALGVFKDLPTLLNGDIIEVERGDGKVFQYKVVESKAVPLEDSDAYMAVASASPEIGRESVTLISCTGEWSEQRQTFLSRQFVRAVLVDS